MAVNQRRLFPIVPILAIALAVGAIASIVALENRASLARNAQLKLVAASSSLNGIQTLPWEAQPQIAGHSSVRARLLEAEQGLLTTFAELQRQAPNPRAAAVKASVAANFAVLESIYKNAASNRVAQSDNAAIGAQKRTSATARIEVAGAGDAYARNARTNQREAIAGAGVAIGVMLGAFLFFFRRSRQAMRAKQGALAASEVAHEALVERQQELSQALGRLEESRQERERLLERTVEIAEHERINLAGDLHDGPIQQLTVVALMLDQLTGRIGRGELDQTQAAIAQIRENVSGQMTSLRGMMVELRPPMLDEGGISAGLHDLAESVLSDTRLTWDVRSTIGNARFAPEIETVAYRVAREALVNTRKHAEATDVEVILEHDRDTLHLVIADNGKGFTRPEATRTGEHSGLLGIEERLASIGGTCALHTAPGTGTRWEASLPWKLQPAHGRLDGHSLVAV